MKQWFAPGLTEEELKKEYRKLAREYHPDMHVGQADHDDYEEYFKEISSQYAAYFVKLSTAEAPGVDDIQEATLRRTNIARAIVEEVYPRTDIGWSVGAYEVFMEFHRSTPLQKMVHIVQLVKESMGAKCPVICEFYRDGAKKRRTLTLIGNAALVDCELADVPLSGYKVVSAGRRYKVMEQGRWQMVEDTKTQMRYAMRKTPKLNLKELLGI